MEGVNLLELLEHIEEGNGVTAKRIFIKYAAMLVLPVVVQFICFASRQTPIKGGLLELLQNGSSDDIKSLFVDILGIEQDEIAPVMEAMEYTRNATIHYNDVLDSFITRLK